MVLADFESTGTEEPYDPTDPDVIVTDPYNPIGLSTSMVEIASLSFMPTTRTKFLLLAQCMSGTTYGTTIDACQTILGPSAFLVDGTTVAQTSIGSLHTYYCLDAEIGTTYTLSIKASRLNTDGNDSAYGVRIGAVGLDTWYRIEQGVEAELSGPTVREQAILMEDILEPKFGTSLVFNYGEVMTDEAANIRTAYSVEFDSSKLRGYKPIDMVLQQKLGFQEDFTDVSYSAPSRWSCLSSANIIDFRGSRTSVKYACSKLSGADGNTHRFRRLRTVIIPFFNNPFGTNHSIFTKGGETKTGTETESVTLTPQPRTVDEFQYLILANVKTDVSTGDGPHQTVFRYNGLGMAGVTTNLVALTGLLHVVGTTSTYLAGVTYGLRNDDILAVKTYNITGGTSQELGYNGEQYFGFNMVTATQTMRDNYYFFSGTQFQSETEVVARTGDRLMAVIQLHNLLGGI